MLKIVDAQTMQAIDRKAVSEHGIAGHKLMEQAGKRLASHTLRCVSHDAHTLVAVLAGGGKNGGDGLVCARYLARAGIRVAVFLLAEKLAPETLDNLQRLTSENVPVKQYADRVPAESLELIGQADCVIDALLGIGLSGDPREPMATVIQIVNRANTTVIAADIPSGLNADTGLPGRPTIKADCTVTFGLPKQGLLLASAAGYVGQLTVETIGFPKALLTTKKEPLAYYDKHAAAADLPRRAAQAHKRTSGKVLIIGGSAHFHGALLLAAMGAKYAGAGYIRLAYPRQLDTVIRSHALEEICVPVAAAASGCFNQMSLQPLLELAGDADAVVIGPGIGRTKATLECVKGFLHKVTGPRLVVVDADALHVLSDYKVRTQSAKIPAVVITPHAGEAAAVLKVSGEDVEFDREKAARQLLRKTNAAVVLKGRHTMCAMQDGSVKIIGSGTQALATAGTGDVLAGVTAAFAAQKADALAAVAVAAAVHGIAGEMASYDLFGLGVTAGRVAQKVPQAIRFLRILPRQAGIKF